MGNKISKTFSLSHPQNGSSSTLDSSSLSEKTNLLSSGLGGSALTQKKGKKEREGKAPKPPKSEKSKNKEEKNQKDHTKYECPVFLVSPGDYVNCHTSDGSIVAIKGYHLSYASYHLTKMICYYTCEEPVRDIYFHDYRFETYEVFLRFQALLEGGKLIAPDLLGDPQVECGIIENLAHKLAIWKACRVSNVLKLTILEWIWKGQIDPACVFRLAGIMREPELVGASIRSKNARSWSPIFNGRDENTEIANVQAWEAEIPKRYRAAFTKALKSFEGLDKTETGEGRWVKMAEVFEQHAA
ncbi:uncharacterized protein I303_107813 [Kwoniella dejecticola CBS 10117]|uniref:Uncharacterized protein n=1 Tax=Kwoniella dejecticola CBS 10117 TaxID=1296121 RepID=A0A1A5ZVS0_9TREE|nr:uncharacterized protein I303_07816 [Kwoniella dejecticola CBS 10117]OBR81906.1 hypothetical protein I303_07816 [Kwoniella dejecticola CBS 10117]